MADSKVTTRDETSAIISVLNKLKYSYNQNAVIPIIWSVTTQKTSISSDMVDGMDVYKVDVSREDAMRFIFEHMQVNRFKVNLDLMGSDYLCNDFAWGLLLVYGWGGIFQYGDGSITWDSDSSIPRLVRNMNRRNIQFFQNHTTLAAIPQHSTVLRHYVNYCQKADPYLGLKESIPDIKSVVTTCTIDEYTIDEEYYRPVGFFLRLGAIAAAAMGFIWIARQ